MLGPIGIGAIASSGAVEESTPYQQVLVDTYGADEVWPLVDIESGTAITAYANSARNGTLTGWDLQNAAGPVSDTLAPFSDGANDHGNIFTSNGNDGLVDIFDGTVGSFFVWLRVANAGVWSDDGGRRYGISLFANSNNFIVIRRGLTNDELEFLYRAGGVNTQVDKSSMSTTDWFSVGMSWSAGAAEVKAFFNGAQQGTTQTTLGTWSGTPASNGAVIGAVLTTPADIWHGWIAYASVKFGAVWTPDDFLNMHNAAVP